MQQNSSSTNPGDTTNDPTTTIHKNLNPPTTTTTTNVNKTPSISRLLNKGSSSQHQQNNKMPVGKSAGTLSDRDDLIELVSTTGASRKEHRETSPGSPSTSDKQSTIVGCGNDHGHESHHHDERHHHNDHHHLMNKSFLMGFIPRWTFHPNKQSEARDLLAVERTQLAWVRTGLSTIAIGIAIAKLLTSDADSEAAKILMVTIGTIFIVLGLLIFCYSFVRFHYATRRLISGVFVADMFSPVFMFVFGVTACIAALALVFV
ncbi:hypothetical protein C9374_014610 [Naegleria lovaniensis]|uniref:DUF202 domain-containing protein n=1 Tax=Naegleria lovaniensis TaxID=51637 RepID=A0AA88GUL8_NAELO|nr:uncharacterized protein C9374_014610 [Naegleria lovaniensis]KAG2389210.1 hypothetical protein C9374_014610 [Naegleria lovaniensis]